MIERYKKATMSILGLYYLDPTIFDNIAFPDELNRDLLIDNILAECAELEIIYPDPDYMKRCIALWSLKELPNWQKLYNTTQFMYNPIWNVDASITETETRDLKNQFTNNESGNNTAINSQKGYNDNEFVGAGKDDLISSIGRDGTSNDTGSITRETKRGGNIGVTSTQSLIQEEREVDKFNIYDFITDSFKRRFCILVY